MTDTIRYVNTASSGGDGTTNGTSGATAAYASLNAFEAAEAATIDAADRLICKCSGTEDNSGVSFVGGWVVNGELHVIGNPDTADGKYDGALIQDPAFYHLTESLQFRNNKFVFVLIDGLQLEEDETHFAGSRALHLNSFFEGESSFLVQNNRVVRDSGLGGSSKDGLSASRNSASILHVIFQNNLVLGFRESDAGGIVINTASPPAGSTVKIFHNTIVDCKRGIECPNGTTTIAKIKNNAIFNHDDDLYQVSLASSGDGDFNCHDDAAETNETNLVDASPGGTEATDWAALVTDYDGGGSYPYDADLTPKDADSDLVDQAGLGSGSDADLPTTDIIGVTRSTSAATIGAFEFEVAAAGGNLLLSHPPEFMQ